jgi:DNA-binding transcriptional MocR family regulator
MPDWSPVNLDLEKPRYLAIADAIASDIKKGRLAAGDRLPPQRKLAQRLGVDFTTVARGYVEAGKRGLVISTVGRGTFVQAENPALPLTAGLATSGLATAGLAGARRLDPANLTMNLPPEPDDLELLERMRAGLVEIARDLSPLLRYQWFGGTQEDKDAASSWLGRRALVPAQERIFISPGVHPALTGIFGTMARPGDAVLSDRMTYPGLRSIAAQMGLRLRGLPTDANGIEPSALAEACVKLRPKALYLNPTLHNPTGLTMPARRRDEIAIICRRYGLPIVEDDAYGFIPPHGPAPFAAIAPDITWHVAGLSKCIGAGLRVAYVIAPSAKAGWPFAAAMRAANVMASPLTVALATRWIQDGTADSILRFIRRETIARQELAAHILTTKTEPPEPLSFCLWMRMPEGWTRSAFLDHMRATGLGIVTSDAFTIEGEPPEAARLCLGGPISRRQLEHALEFMAHALGDAPSAAASFL